MITLNRKLKKEHTEPPNGVSAEPCRRISVRDKLLVKEVQEMTENLPTTCSVSFDDPNVLNDFVLTVAPDEGYWQGGKFKFNIFVTDDYNMAVSWLFLSFETLQGVQMLKKRTIIDLSMKLFCEI